MTGFADALAWIKSNFDVTGGSAVPPPPKAAPLVAMVPPVVPAAPVSPSLGVTPNATTKAFEDLLTLREGKRNVVYLDTAKPPRPTVGIGHLVVPGDCLQVGDRISDAAVDLLFQKDSADALSHARILAKAAGINDETFIPYLASVCYQLGDSWIKKFPNTWAMIWRGEYEAAAQALDTSEWADQTPARVEDFQGALRRLPVKPKS